MAGVEQMDRISMRVERQLKREAEDVLKAVGLNLSDGINVFLRRLVATGGIPFPVAQTRTEMLGPQAAQLEASVQAAVRAEVASVLARGVPVARWDLATQTPYLESPDGRAASQAPA